MRQIYKNKFVISLSIATYDDGSEEGYKSGGALALKSL
jgi:hypothetical protein